MTIKFSRLALLFILTVFSRTGFSQSADAVSTPALSASDVYADQQHPLAAKWDIILKSSGQDTPGKIQISREGGVFTGILITSLGNSPLNNLLVQQNSFTADVVINSQGSNITGTISGIVEKDQLSGTYDLSGYPTFSFLGQKN